MILFLDTTSDTYVLALATREGRILRMKSIVRGERIGDKAFRIIQGFCKGKKPEGCIVVTGPGRFSGIRHSITIANTLGFAWGIPLYGVQKKSGETLHQLLDRSFRQKSSSLLIPFYGREPNITL